jgi:hypothetical protein
VREVGLPYSQPDGLTEAGNYKTKEKRTRKIKTKVERTEKINNRIMYRRNLKLYSNAVVWSSLRHY